MLYTKIQPLSFLGSGEDFQEFLPYMDMEAILFNCAEPFEQIPSIVGPFEILWKLLKQFQRRRHLKITKFYTFYIYIAQ